MDIEERRQWGFAAECSEVADTRLADAIKEAFKNLNRAPAPARILTPMYLSIDQKRMLEVCARSIEVAKDATQSQAEHDDYVRAARWIKGMVGGAP